jgi:DNA-binding transcriptional MerR regulator
MAKKLLEGYVPEVDAAAELNITVRTLQVWRQRRIGPSWTKVGSKVYYSRDAFTDWLKRQEQKPVRSGHTA